MYIDIEGYCHVRGEKGRDYIVSAWRSWRRFAEHGVPHGGACHAFLGAELHHQDQTGRICVDSVPEVQCIPPFGRGGAWQACAARQVDSLEAVRVHTRC